MCDSHQAHMCSKVPGTSTLHAVLSPSVSTHKSIHDSFVQSDLNHRISDAGSQWLELPNITGLSSRACVKNEPKHKAIGF